MIAFVLRKDDAIFFKVVDQTLQNQTLEDLTLASDVEFAFAKSI